jgi:hypothetical protein
MPKIKIYPDSKDLIDLFEKSYPCSPDEFENELNINDAEIVLSSTNIEELSAPLSYSKKDANIMKTLIRIEKMPIRFISESKIAFLELNEAVHAFNEEREYLQINPFVSRFDETLSVNGLPPTKDYISYGLPETVFDLWQAGFDFKGLKGYALKLRRLFEIERSIANKPNLNEEFMQAVDRKLKSSKLEILPRNLKSFAEWIYKEPKRCPSLRIGYEVYHNMVKDRKSIPEDSTMDDLCHANYIPYVDFISFDRRMYHYIKQTCLNENLGYERGLYKNLSEIFAVLKKGKE